METAALTRSFSKVKSKLSSKFKLPSDENEGDHVLKAMRYDDTLPLKSPSGAMDHEQQSPSAITYFPVSPMASASVSPAPAQTASITPSTTTIASESTSLSISASNGPSSAIPPTMTKSASHSSLRNLLKSVPSTAANSLANSMSGSISSASTAETSLRGSRTSIEIHSQLEKKVGNSPTNSRKTSFDKEHNVEGLLPAINTDTSFASPCHRLTRSNGSTPPISPKKVSFIPEESVTMDVSMSSDFSTDNNNDSMSTIEPQGNDFADAMAASILDKVDEIKTTEQVDEWKI